MRLRALWLIAVLLISEGVPAEAVPRYVLLDLGTLGGPAADAYGVNNFGNAVGRSRTATGEEHAFLWWNGTMRDLGALCEGCDSDARAVKRRRQVVGLSYVNEFDSYGDQIFRAFLWQKGVMTELPGLGGSRSAAYDINDLGQIVGWADVVEGSRSYWHACLWQGGTVTDLGTLGGPVSSALAINKGGQVVGCADTAQPDPYWSYARHAFLWEDGVMRDLGTLGGSRSKATGLNDLGWVVGESDTGEVDRHGWSVWHAFLWRDGVMTDLGTLPGDVYSWAYDVNNRGQIVGYSLREFGWGRAFLWQDGVMYDLNDLITPNVGWHVQVATDISDSGLIVGLARFWNSEFHIDLNDRAVLLIPVPEPASALLLAFGLSLAGCRVRLARKVR